MGRLELALDGHLPLGVVLPSRLVRGDLRNPNRMNNVDMRESSMRVCLFLCFCFKSDRRFHGYLEVVAVGHALAEAVGVGVGRHGVGRLEEAQESGRKDAPQQSQRLGVARRPQRHQFPRQLPVHQQPAVHRTCPSEIQIEIDIEANTKSTTTQATMKNRKRDAQNY